MADTTINISGYDNEDIDQQFTLRSGDINSSSPYDLTGIDLEAEIRDQKGNLILRMTSAGDDGGIVVNDAANGIFTLHISQGTITFNANRSMKYDLLILSGGEIRRLWGGSVKISAGVTVP